MSFLKKINVLKNEDPTWGFRRIIVIFISLLKVYLFLWTEDNLIKWLPLGGTFREFSHGHIFTKLYIQKDLNHLNEVHLCTLGNQELLDRSGLTCDNNLKGNLLYDTRKNFCTTTYLPSFVLLCSPSVQLLAHTFFICF